VRLRSAPVVWLAVFVAGSIGGSLCDQIHVQSGVLVYQHPWLADQAWWVGPQFGAGLLVVFAGARAAIRVTDRVAARGAVVDGLLQRRLVGDGLWFLAAYTASGLGHRHPAVLAAALGLTWVLRLAVRSDRWQAGSFSIALTLGGVLYEGTLAGTDAFHYTHPDIYHVPVWLAGIYLHGGPLALTVARYLRHGMATTPRGR
jgi:hypothetical protein